MPFNRAWLILPSKRVQKQKTKTSNQLSSSISKVVLTRLFKRSKKTKEQKTVLSKSECFCENTSELQFAHSLIT